MILGIGSDLVSFARIERIYTRFGQKFLDRMFSPTEQQKIKQSHNPIKTIASRFAAKEAAAKALGLAIRGGIHYADFQVTNDEWGKPHLHLMGKAAGHLHRLAPNGARLHLSLSDEKDYALAMVVIEHRE
jgi:holo-[acyl-carrier protein] synthase